MSVISFGTGTLWGCRTDAANSTPVKFGVLQDVSVDFSADTKELYGSNQFPVAVGRGKGKISCKAKFAQIQGGVFADLFFGVSTATGQTAFVDSETGTVPTTPFQITVSNAASFADDMGVVFSSTGLPLKKVSSAPAAGQYSVSAAGVYTFNTGDSTKAVLISYTYTVAASGQKMTITNQALGIQPVFSVYLKTAYTGASGTTYSYLKLNSCVSSKLSLPTKQDDFSIMELDFAAFADSSGTIGTFSMNEVS
jgi:hypothetical protein